jgi:hypothetical protein
MYISAIKLRSTQNNVIAAAEQTNNWNSYWKDLLKHANNSFRDHFEEHEWNGNCTGRTQSCSKSTNHNTAGSLTESKAITAQCTTNILT